jgi:hypothetical protein
MEERTVVDVLICGAGAAGLTLAIDLARRGVPFRIVDQLERPFSGSRGKGLQPRTQEVFEDLGIIDRIMAMADVPAHWSAAGLGSRGAHLVQDRRRAAAPIGRARVLVEGPHRRGASTIGTAERRPMNRNERLRLALRAEDEILRQAQEILLDQITPGRDEDRETINHLLDVLDGPKAHEARRIAREALGLPALPLPVPAPDEEIEEVDEE